MYLKKITTLSLLTISLTGCALLTPYTPPIQQGKIISAKMIDQLKPGMTESQVSYILGSPDIQDPFHQSTWNYVYTFQRNSHSSREEKKLTLNFKDAKLTQISGDYPPPHVIYDTSQPKPTKTEGTTSEQAPSTTNNDATTTNTGGTTSEQASSTTNNDATTTNAGETTSEQAPSTTNNDATTTNTGGTTSEQAPSITNNDTTTTNTGGTTSEQAPSTTNNDATTTNTGGTTSEQAPSTTNNDATTANTDGTTSEQAPSTTNNDATTTNTDGTTSKTKDLNTPSVSFPQSVNTTH